MPRFTSNHCLLSCFLAQVNKYLSMNMSKGRGHLIELIQYKCQSIEWWNHFRCGCFGMEWAYLYLKMVGFLLLVLNHMWKCISIPRKCTSSVGRHSIDLNVLQILFLYHSMAMKDCSFKHGFSLSFSPSEFSIKSSTSSSGLAAKSFLNISISLGATEKMMKSHCH